MWLLLLFIKNVKKNLYFYKPFLPSVATEKASLHLRIALFSIKTTATELKEATSTAEPKCASCSARLLNICVENRRPDFFLSRRLGWAGQYSHCSKLRQTHSCPRTGSRASKEIEESRQLSSLSLALKLMRERERESALHASKTYLALYEAR